MTAALHHRRFQYGWFESVPCALLAVLSLALTLFAFHHTLEELLGAWQTSEYSHGMIVPFIALLLAWHGLVRVRPALKSSRLGLWVLALSAGCLLIGQLAAFEAAAEYGLILALVGLSLAFFGRKATRSMAAAFVYLFFAVPLPHIVYSALSQHLQLISSTLGVWCLDLLAIPVFQQGNVIDLGGYKLQVVDACSGLRYLFPLMSFGYLVAYLLDDRMWKRLMVFLSVIPITIIMNSLRIAFVGVTVNLWGTSMAEGFLHEFEGWVVFLLCTMLLMAEVFLLLRIGKRGRFRFEYLGPAHGKAVFGFVRLKATVILAFVFTGLLAILFGTNAVERRTEFEPQHQALFTFPRILGEWHGHQQSLDAGILQGLQLSDYWLADYSRGADKAIINFYIAYYARQRVGTEAHSPSNCIPSGGWQVVSEDIKKLTLADGRELKVTRLLIREGSVSQLVYYWFDERGRDITDTYRAKWYLLIDSLKLGRTDGALVRLVTPLAEGEDASAADQRLKDFLMVSYPVLPRFIPGGTQGDMLSTDPVNSGAGSAGGHL